VEPNGITHWDGPPLSAWAPWSPQQAACELAGIDVPWCVVGGFAIDLFLGEPTRSHEDLEISIPRAAFAALRQQLSAFKFHTVGKGQVRTLPPDALPGIETNQNWVLDAAANVWRMDVMLGPGDSDTWIFRRDERIRAPRRQMVSTRDGVPFLNPEGVLLYKAKAQRPKDEQDFAAVRPRLDPQATTWLREALLLVHPEHAWIHALA
jgi:aminoglycoside-2''-adenylyltransferase